MAFKPFRMHYYSPETAIKIINFFSSFLCAYTPLRESKIENARIIIVLKEGSPAGKGKIRNRLE
jgi:hypothetical protein